MSKGFADLLVVSAQLLDREFERDSILKSKHHYRYDRMIDITAKYGVV